MQLAAFAAPHPRRPALLGLSATPSFAHRRRRENQANWALANRFTTEALLSSFSTP